ncbi:MAG: hypothetical protein LBS07_03600 [Prevotellaceae bacterium]|jgi:hypothetical protein|nr:hypothetical protein [Prevotellaceae bacterium]
MKTNLIKILLTGLCVIGLIAKTNGNPLDDLDFDYAYNVTVADWVEAIRVTEPVLRSEINGVVTVRFNAENMLKAKAMCWQAPNIQYPDPEGHDVNLTPQGIELAETATDFLFLTPIRFLPVP